MGCIVNPNPKFDLYDATNDCARSNTLLLPLADVSTGVVSLVLPEKVRKL